MRRRIGAFGAFLFCGASALAACSLASGSPHAAPAILAYYASSERGSPAALKAHFAYFNEVATDVFNTNEQGKISGRMPGDALAFAQSKGYATYATVSNYGHGDFQPSIAHAIITSPAITQAFLDGMMKKLAEGHYTGINVDFESLKPEDRFAFTAFIGATTKKMHDGGYTLVLSVPAVLNDDPTNSWSGAFDLAALGAVVDVMQVMTYDENGPWGPAGPVAGLDWVEKAVQYTASVVPPAKISLGIPAFGYDWDLTDKTKSGQLNWIRVGSLLAETKSEAQWDEASSSPYFKYEQAGHPHVAWYENEKSLGLKAQLVAKYHLGGISVWALGMEDEPFWQALALQPRR